jgi:hypothetical protein
VVRGGEISPSPLLRSPCADTRHGEEPYLWIRPGPTATGDEIPGFRRDRITHFPIPRDVLFAERFLFPVTGEVPKFVIWKPMARELAATPAG